MNDQAGRSLTFTMGPFEFRGKFETQKAPVSVALFAGLLPLECDILHARWSGEAGWAPLGAGLALDAENTTCYPHPGQLLLYAGKRSEPELLIPYGACAFASRAGKLPGNHVVTLQGDLSDLSRLGDLLLWQGRQTLRVE